ncbi:MAG: hypothetical protein DA329_10995 [Candidatus Nitrosocosmicus sp.]|nr:hypothetical protein [Candidatus Nitrosocosmicus sp.]
MEGMPKMISTNTNTTQEYKQCAGKNCENTGIVQLEIKFVKKKGLFCEQCTSELIQLGIASKLEVNNINEV